MRKQRPHRRPRRTALPRAVAVGVLFGLIFTLLSITTTGQSPDGDDWTTGAIAAALFAAFTYWHLTGPGDAD